MFDMPLIEREIKLEKVIGTEAQIRMLFDILKTRTHNISNKVNPLLNEHIRFVRNHPYRAWYLIKMNLNYIGTAYLMKSNCVGINLFSNVDVFPYVVQLILEKHKPLKEIKSVRPPFFYINIAPNNKEVKYQLTKLNAQLIQSTFILTPT